MSDGRFPDDEINDDEINDDKIDNDDDEIDDDRPATGSTPSVSRHRESGKREWQHIRGTRIRTSTAVLVISFLALFALYGYTSQRYGVVAPAQPEHTNHAPRTTHSHEYSSTPSVSTTRSSETSESASEESGQFGDTQNTSTERAPITTTQMTIPGLPGVSIPVPAFPTTTETTGTTPER